MEIIDCQVHVADPDAMAQAADGPSEIVMFAMAAQPVTTEVQLAAMEAVGVDITVMNIPRGLCRKPRADGFSDFDNSYAEQAATDHPGKFYSVTWVDMVAPDVDDALARHQEHPGVVGIRQRIGPADLPSISDGLWDPFFSSLERRGIPLFIAAEGILQELEPTIRRHPELQFVVDHFGLNVPQIIPPESGGPFDRSASTLALAQYPNVAVKWGGSQRLSLEPYPFSDIWPHMRQFIEAFGVDRLMFASDWTLCRQLHSYAEDVFHIRDSDQLSETEKAAIFAGTARRLLHIDAA
jgi:predicted TIM-barrel fold metal-dependent hydrolase